MNIIKNNFILILASVLITITLGQAYMVNKKDSTIDKLNETIISKASQVETLNGILQREKARKEKAKEHDRQAAILEQQLTEKITEVNEELYRKNNKEVEVETRLNNIKSRIKNIAVARPESLARLINLKNTGLFKRASDATTF